MCYLTDKKVCRKEYNTEQRKMLLNYLKENSHREFSIDALALELGEISGGKIGKSTIYRQVKELCRSGLLRRFRKEGKTVAEPQCGEHRLFPQITTFSFVSSKEKV